MIRLLMITAALVGCGSSGGSETEPVQGTPDTRLLVTMVGDSTCHREGSPARMLGWFRVCASGRKLISVDSLPQGKVYLGMGANDAIEGVDINAFELHVMQLLTPSTTCVLPTINATDTTAFRDVLIKHCPDYIDPHDVGVYGQLDGYHFTEQENYNLMQALEEHWVNSSSRS